MLSQVPIQQVQQVVITDAHADQRVDNFLLNFLRGVPKSRIYRIIRKGEVRVNKRRVCVSYRLVPGDSLRIPPIRLDDKLVVKHSPGSQLKKLVDTSILYEDDHLIVIDKPPGLAVHGGSGISLGLIETLRKMRQEKDFLELVHRIDRDTSGCVMIAKKRAMLVHLHTCLLNGTIHKRYLALVKASWRGGKVVDAPLHKYLLKSGERMVKVAANGKLAKTTFSVLETCKAASLIEAIPLTGRTHQIRVHCAFMGHPIFGDQKYGDEMANRQAKAQGLDRLLLHAYQLIVPMLGDLEPLVITAPKPACFEQMMKALDK